MNAPLLTDSQHRSFWRCLGVAVRPWLWRKWAQGELYLQVQIDKETAIAERTRAEARQLDALTDKTRMETQCLRVEMELRVFRELRGAPPDSPERKLLERMANERLQ